MHQHQSRRKYSPYVKGLCLALFVVCAADSIADQDDPRLIPLFEQLQNADNPNVAKKTETEIWAIWHETPDDKSMEIMRNARASLDGRDFESAIESLNELVVYKPDFAEAWNQRAIVLFIAEDYDGSLRDIEQTLALEPRHFGALSGRGQIYLHLDEPELALQAFEAALDRNPWMADIRGQVEMVRAYINSKQKPI